MKFLNSKTIYSNYYYHQRRPPPPPQLREWPYQRRAHHQMMHGLCQILIVVLLLILVPQNAHSLQEQQPDDQMPPPLAQAQRQQVLPQFVKSMDSHTIRENTMIGEVVYTLEAQLTNTDTGQSIAGVRFVYGIEGSPLFSVNKTSGQVRVAQLIDREQTSDSVSFQVVATPYLGQQPAGPPAQLGITVFILDENDNAPKLERIRVGQREYDAQMLAPRRAALTNSMGPTIRLNVSETAPLESIVVDLIEASDVDKASTNPLTAYCLDCEPEFELRPSRMDDNNNENNNQQVSLLLNDRLERSIVLVKPLVHVPRNNIRQLHVMINDGKFNTSLLFELTIDDVQNKPPQFIGSTTCIVKENIALDKVIMTVQAIDGDAMAADEMIMPPRTGKSTTTSQQQLAAGRQLIYDFVSQGGQSTSQQEDFKLHPLTGELQVANRLDREAYLQSNGVLSLRVRARELTIETSDSVVGRDEQYDSILSKVAPYVDQSPEASSEVEITVILVDVNDNEPHWLNASELSALNVNPSPYNWHQSLPNDRDTGRNYQIRVPENTPAGSPITGGGTSKTSDLFVYDLDNGDNSEFNITLVDPFNLFDVEPKQAKGFAHVTLKLLAANANGNKQRPLATGRQPNHNHNQQQRHQPLDYENINERSYIIELHATETRTAERSSSKAQVQVFVVDVNDNAPEFNETSYMANIREDVQPGRTVKLVQATDRDDISAKRITYSLHGKSAYLFDIHPTSGLVTVAKCEHQPQQQHRFRANHQHQQNMHNHPTSQRPCIDYETQRSHHLMVEASDGELASKVPLTVFIEDASDNAPVFRLPIVDVAIEEGSERLDPPIKIEASDVDQTSVISYSIVEGNFEGLFAINNVTGELQLTRPIRIAHDDDDHHHHHHQSSGLNQQQAPNGEVVMMTDYRQQQHKWNKMQLIVQASDGQHAVNGTIRIDVLDANDNAPKFAKAHYEREINESYGAGQHVITVKAFDLDRGNNARVSYRLEKGSHGHFTINESSGEISVAGDSSTSSSRPFDASKRQNYTLEVVAYDHGLISKSSHVSVHIHVLESSLKAPKFEPQIQRATVLENTLNNSIIHHMCVLVDQVTTCSYPQATDMSSSSSSSSRSLIFEPGPIEGLDKYGLQVTDTERLESMFGVSTNTGDVVVNAGLDHDFAAHVNLTIYVSSIVSSRRLNSSGQADASLTSPLAVDEQLSPKATGYLIINVVDDNSNGPFFAAPWTPQQPELSFQLSEELPVGSVLTQLVANDVDSKISHFKIEPPNEYFELASAQSGVIVTKKVIDYDALMRQTFLTPGSHHHRSSLSDQLMGPTSTTTAAMQANNVIQFNVFAYDSGEPQLFAKAIVSVEILPVNDWDCKFEQANYEVHVRENSQVDTVVVQVRANDLDYGEQHNQISYSLLGEHRDLFNIDQRTGVVTVSNRGSINLDREQLTKSTLTMTVIGRDEQQQQHYSHQASNSNEKTSKQHPLTGGGRSCSASLRVHVDDVNDNPPLFSQKVYEVTAYDTDTVDVPLIKLITRDDDSTANVASSSSISISGSSPKQPTNAVMNSFRILAGNINDSFNISSSGVVYATKPLNESLSAQLNGQPSIQLRVQVKQQTLAAAAAIMAASNLPTIFTDECLVKINLVKINRFAPEWRQDSLKAAKVEENQAPGALVTQLRCWDRDHHHHQSAGGGGESLFEQPSEPSSARRKSVASKQLEAGQSSPIRYWIKDGGTNVLETREFRLDSVSGQLTTRVQLDREAREYYELIVSCEDNGKPQSLESISPLYIPVLDVDDNKPEFVVLQNREQQHPQQQTVDYKMAPSTKAGGSELASKIKRPVLAASVSFSVEEQQGKGLPVGELKAFDRDLRSPFPIIYCLIEGNEFQEFSLDSITGILYTNQTLDREKQSTYDLLVKAINDGSTCEEQTRNASTTKHDHNQSLVWVKVHVLDINDNSPIFRRQIHRAGVHHRSLMNTQVTQVAAYDPDAGLNGTLNYKISEILMYKTNQGGQQSSQGSSSSSSRKYEVNSNDNNNHHHHHQSTATLSKPIKLIQRPFKIDQQGNLYTQQLLTQYQLMSMFVLQIEASEQAEPWRTATTKLEVHIYETNSQLKMKINLHPKLIDVYRYEIEALLSNATKYTAIINRARSYSGNIDSTASSTSSSGASALSKANKLTKTMDDNKSSSSSTNKLVPSLTTLGQNPISEQEQHEPSFSYIHLIFVDNYRIVNPNLVMEKFDLTSAQLFTPQLLHHHQTITSNNNLKSANGTSNKGELSSELQLMQDTDVSSLIDKIALASVQSAEYHSHPSGLAGIDWLESPSMIYVCFTALLTLIGLLMCLIGCCCTSRIKDHIIKVAMDKMVKQQALQTKINERVLAATNQAYANSNANNNNNSNGHNHHEFMLQQGGLMSSFDATKSCMNNNYENMSMLQRAMEAGEYIDPNYTTLNGHLNMGAHYYDTSEFEEQQQHQINIGGDIDHHNHHHHETSIGNGGAASAGKQMNGGGGGSNVSLSLVDADMDDSNNITNSNGEHDDGYPVGDLNNHLVKNNKTKLFSNATNGVVSSNSRLRQQIPTSNNNININNSHLQHEL